MLNHFMAELGCDYPEITLKLDRNFLPAGESLAGSFLLWPEILEGTDNPIELEFVMLAQFEHEIKETVIARLQTDRFVMDKQEGAVELAFRYQLPNWLPVSTHAIRYYLRPKLPDKYLTLKETGVRTDSFFGLPPIIVQPNRCLQSILDALSRFGYQEKPDSRYWDGTSQDFDFVASRGHVAETSEFTLAFQQYKQNVIVNLQYAGKEPVKLEMPESDTQGQQLVAWLISTLQNPNS